jgi:trehalose transport system substrate-binding protein
MLLVVGIIRPPELSGGRIVFVVDLADEEMMVMRDILDELEPELRAEVFLMSVDSSRYVDRLDKMVRSDDMRWDLLAADNNMVGILAAKGLVEELTNFMERDILIPKTLLPSLRPILVFEDRFYFAPFRPNVKIAFFNEEKFNQYGLSPPRTWHELLEVARVFKEKEGVGRVAIQGFPGKTAAVTVFEFVKAGGGDPVRLSDEGSRKTFEFLQELEPYLAPEYAETSYDTANELLIDEHVYLVMNWTFAIKVVVEDAGKTEIKAYSGWRGPQGEFHVLGGDVLAIPKGAPHPNEATKLLELLLSKEVQQTLFDRLRWLPVRSDAYEDVSPELSPYFDAVLDAVSYAVTRPADPQWGMVECVLDRAFTGLVKEGEPIDSLAVHCASLEAIPLEYIRYCVESGDTLETIAYHFNTTVAVLVEANGITPKTSIGPGQILLVPGE